MFLTGVLLEQNNTCSWWQQIQENCDWRSCLICIRVGTEFRPVSSGCWETPLGLSGRHTTLNNYYT